MTISEALAWSQHALSKAGVKTSRLDSLLLIVKVTGYDKAKILAHDDLLLSKKQINVFKSLVKKRAQHIPITQLTEMCEFYGRSFYINKNVMSPRPETEKMIDIFLNLTQHDYDLNHIKKISAADIGTGCGAIGITIKKELPNVQIDLIDNDTKALKVAKINVVINTLHNKIIKSDLLFNTRRTYHTLLCNLPYVPDDYVINKEAQQEPRSSIFGGSDGLDVYRRLFSQLEKIKNKPLLILTEALPFSHRTLAEIAHNCDYMELINDDFIQAFKYVE